MKKNMTNIMNQTVQNLADREGKYLTFSMAGEEYGIGILKVKEIIGLMTVTPIPQAPQYIKGVINLRGKIIPIVDLRLKFGIDSMDYNERSCIIVVEITSDSNKIAIGIVVDSVSEVLNIKAAEIEDTPNFGSLLDTAYILGMAKIGQNVKILLDIDKVMVGEEIDLLKAA